MAQKGLSPRRRGNRFVRLAVAQNHRSIPAQAGEPNSCLLRRMGTQVYPRAGGGTIYSAFSSAHLHGLSPRRRGNLDPATPPTFGVAFVPVYPRAGGGTLDVQVAMRRYDGLSPRRRGNRVCLALQLFLFRSIPAQAGEPS